jgi:glycoside/pentoside/hexuronide:cation symporter, GPH family
MTAASPSDGRLGWPTRIAWMVCAMPELLKSFAWDAFVLFYYTQVVGLNGGLLGIALVVILIFDAVVDPYIGALSDRLRGTPLGRRHTLMAAAIVPFAIGLYCVFAPPAGMSQLEIFAWLLGFGLLARVGISFWTVPAYALGGELSRDPKERSIVAVLRNLGNQAVILSVPAIAFGFYFTATPGFSKPQLNPAPYPGFGLFAATLGVVLMLIGLIGTLKRGREIETESGHLAAPDDGGSPLEIVRRFFAAIRITPNIGRLALVALLVLFTNSVVNQLTLHLSTYFWQLDGGATQRLLMAGVTGSIAAMFFAPWFMRKVGTRAAMISGLATFFVVQALAIVLPLLGLAPPPGSVAIGVFVFVFRFIGGAAYALYVVPFNTVTYDIGDEHEANTGAPQQGLVASFMFLGLQVGSGLVSLLAGGFLALIAFPVGVPVERMPMGVAGVAMAILVGTFRISAEKQAAIRAKLAAARAQSAEKRAPAP